MKEVGGKRHVSSDVSPQWCLFQRSLNLCQRVFRSAARAKHKCHAPLKSTKCKYTPSTCRPPPPPAPFHRSSSNNNTLTQVIWGGGAIFCFGFFWLLLLLLFLFVFCLLVVFWFCFCLFVCLLLLGFFVFFFLLFPCCCYCFVMFCFSFPCILLVAVCFFTIPHSSVYQKGEIMIDIHVCVYVHGHRSRACLKIFCAKLGPTAPVI